MGVACKKCIQPHPIVNLSIVFAIPPTVDHVSLNLDLQQGVPANSDQGELI